MGLAAQAQTLNNLLVALLALALDVIQMLAAHGNQFEQSTPGRKILAVDIQVIRNMMDPLGEQGHLVGGAAGVSFVELEFFQVDCVFAHGSKGWFQHGGRSVLGWGFAGEASRKPTLGKKNAALSGNFLQFGGLSKIRLRSLIQDIPSNEWIFIATAVGFPHA